MFLVGRDYKREQLLAFTGSRQTQTGIMWGPSAPGCVACTSGGRLKNRHGYADERFPDGSWAYYGQGSAGDHVPTRVANRILLEGQRTVLLFTTREAKRKPGMKGKGTWAKWYRFEGAFVVAAWQWVTPTQGPRAGNALLRFSLVPCEATVATAGTTEEVTSLQGATAVELRERLQSVGAGEPQKGIYNPREYIIRSELIRAYALARAGGACELCDRGAPFLKSNGEPFLEVHHLHRLADGGPDNPSNVAAICPNCHREAHHGVHRDRIAETLTQRIRSRELQVESSVSAV